MRYKHFFSNSDVYFGMNPPQEEVVEVIFYEIDLGLSKYKLEQQILKIEKNIFLSVLLLY